MLLAIGILGSLLLVQGKIEVARSLLERSLAIEPADPRPTTIWDWLCLASAKREQGIAHLEFALRHGSASDRELTRRTLRSIGVEAPK